jgi:hypothetical protein
MTNPNACLLLFKTQFTFLTTNLYNRENGISPKDLLSSSNLSCSGDGGGRVFSSGGGCVFSSGCGYAFSSGDECVFNSEEAKRLETPFEADGAADANSFAASISYMIFAVCYNKRAKE